MKRIGIFLPDASVEDMQQFTEEEFDVLLARAERFQILTQKKEEAGLRRMTAWYLLGAGSLILLVSLGLIVTQAVGITTLPESAITTLIGSVAVEFIGMLWMVIRYLFPQGKQNE